MSHTNGGAADRGTAGDTTGGEGESAGQRATEDDLLLAALAASERRYRHLSENIIDVVWVLDTRTLRFQYVSPSVEALRGFTPEEIMAEPMDAALTPEAAAYVRRSIDERVAAFLAGTGDDHYVDEVQQPRKDGSLVWTEVVGRYHLNPDTGGVEYWAVTRDISARRAAERALAESERRFRLAMEHAPTGMAVVDLDGRVLEVNPALCRMTGRPEAELLERRIQDVLVTAAGASDPLATVLAGAGPSVTVTAHVDGADGARRIVEHSVGLLRDEAGEPLSYVCQAIDVTAARQAEERLRYLATHDPLTSVANRADFTDRVSRVLAHPPRTGRLLAVLYLDLDDFKPINDNLGHAAGDTVLVEVAARISRQVRADDVVARLGGDEFVVALTAIRTPDDARAVAATIHEALAAEFDVAGRPVGLSASIGVALAEPGDDIEAVLAAADQALYEAKRSGRNRTVLSEPGRS